MPLDLPVPARPAVRPGRARQLAAGDGVTLICGRFEGLDQRVIDGFGIEELSLGDFVLSGGEIAAQAVIDAALRLRPGVLGNAASTVEESFADGLLEHPHYTRPALWEGRPIPEVLLSGNHDRDRPLAPRRSERMTKERRPDLWAAGRPWTRAGSTRRQFRPELTAGNVGFSAASAATLDRGPAPRLYAALSEARAESIGFAGVSAPSRSAAIFGGAGGGPRRAT